MKDWTVSYGKNQFFLVATTQKQWGRAAENTLYLIDRISGHRLCSGLRSDFFWNVSIGPRKYEDDPLGGDKPWLENSINSKLIDLHGKIIAAIEDKSVTFSTYLPISDAQAYELNPEFYDDVKALFK